MTQKYINWEIAESKNCGPYSYEILKVETPEHTILYKGFVVFKDNSDYWLENDSKDALRGALITLGQQRS